MFIAPMPLSGPSEAASCSPEPFDLAALVPAAAWGSLPAPLRRRFAVGHGRAWFVGTMELRRSRVGAAFAALARAAGAPLPLRNAVGASCAVSVWAEGGGIVWERRIGHQVVRSVKSAGPAGTVLERTQGGLGMVLDVAVEDEAVVFRSRSFFWVIGRWRVPVPALLTPGRCVVAHRAIDAARFRFTLSMTHPLWGTTFMQDGIFTDCPEDQI